MPITGTRSTHQGQTAVAPAGSRPGGPDSGRGAARPARGRGRRRRVGRDKWLVPLRFPGGPALGFRGALALVLFQSRPILGNVIAFQDYQPYLGIVESPWVGFANFAFLW